MPDIHFKNQIHDVIIIGAGPCGLAVATRLRESTPSALFTDAEHQRYHWIQRHKHRTAAVPTKGRAVNETRNNQKKPIHRYLESTSAKRAQSSILVLDSFSNSWMARWKALFCALEIKHLRSPLFFHPDPSDRDGLKAWAYAHGREKELIQLKGVVGKELSKHRMKSRRKMSNIQRPSGKPIDEREKQDYYTPSATLFDDFCGDCVKRYNLDNLIQQTTVTAIKFSKDIHNVRSKGYFSIETSTGVKYAHTVVLGIGGGHQTSLPIQVEEEGGACHSSSLLKHGLLAPHVRHKINANKDTTVAVIGGGLTSAQIVDLCIRKGVTQVLHIMRGHFKVKHFDLDLSWVAKYKNSNLSAFWMADTDEERFEIIGEARNGGSITPAYKSVLEAHEKSGRMQRYTHTRVVSHDWDVQTKTWKLLTHPPTPNLPMIDYIYFATGTRADIESLPFLQDMRKKYPISTVSGLPCLTDDLQWSSDVPLFITGRFAGLRLGPGAANLEGARVGAERVTWRLQEILDEINAEDYEPIEADEGKRLMDLQKRSESGWTHLNMYEALLQT